MFGRKKKSSFDAKKYLQEREKQLAVERQYKGIVDRHFQLIQLIAEKRKAGNDLRAMFYCKQDIDLVPKLNEYWDKMHEERPNIYSFKFLAMIYEKRGEYDKAIDVCKQAIKLGYSHDGTKGGMKARIEKLKQKAEKANG